MQSRHPEMALSSINYEFYRSRGYTVQNIGIENVNKDTKKYIQIIRKFIRKG